MSASHRTARRRRGRGPGAALLTLAPLLAIAACGGSGSSTSGAKSVDGTVTGAAPVSVLSTAYSAWPEAGCDSRHSTQASVRGPQTSHVRWKAKLGQATEGPTIGPDGTIYEASDAGVLHAINPARGATKWTYDGGGSLTGFDLSTSSAVLPDGTVIWPGPNNTLFGISPTGHLLWKLALFGSPLSPVIANPHELYVMTTNGTLSAVQIAAHSAATRWSIALGKASFGSPVIRADGVVETTVDDSLVALRDNGSSATELWRYTVDKAIEVSPAVTTSGITILGTNDGNEYGISSAGKQLWKHEIDTYSYSSPGVSAAGSAYFGDNHANLNIVNATTGALVKVDHAPVGQIWTAPVIDNAGDVYFGTTGGHVYGYTSSGRQLLDVTTGGLTASYPALSSTGDLLIASHAGDLYSIGH